MNGETVMAIDRYGTPLESVGVLSLMRAGAISVVLCMIAGCRTLQAVPAEPARPLTFKPSQTTIRFVPVPNEVHSADLGSILLRKIVAVPTAPRLGIATVNLQSFPGVDGWMNTWTYTGADAPQAHVYTNSAFYKGHVGVIVDGRGQVATKHPLVQLDGVKKGRRWAVAGGPSFILQPEAITSWALRYGGEREDGHRFVIVDFVDDKEKDVVQDFRIPIEDGRQGFSVRGVTVRVLSYGGGRITYTFAAKTGAE